MIKKYSLLLGVILVLVVVRFLWLGIFPPGLSNDETEYMLSAKSYALYDRDVSGYGFPLSLFKSETDGVIAPIPAILSAPFYLIFDLNIATARLPFVIISLLSAWVIYKLADVLFKNKQAALITVIVFLINPWAFYFSRNTADAPFALLFYLWGLYLLLSSTKHRFLTSFAMFAIGFFSYNGAKTLLLPVVFVALVYLRFAAKRITNWQAILYLLATIIFVGGFVLIANNIEGSVLSVRTKEVRVDNSDLAQSVDQLRRQSVTSPLTSLFVNKPMIAAKEMTAKYLSVFSLPTFFLSGDGRATYRFEDYGLFHLADLGFMVVGLMYLAKKHTRALILILGMIAVAPVASVLSSIELSVVNRSFMILPMIVLVIGQGVYFLFAKFGKSFLRLPALAVSLVLLTSFIYFLNFYLFRFPVTAQEDYWTSERVLVNYLNYETQGTVWVSTEPWNSVMRKIFYSSEVAQDELLKSTYPLNQKKDYIIGHTLITPKCPENIDSTKIYITGPRVECDLGEPSMVIEDHKDAGHAIKIYNSDFCDVPLEPYRRFNAVSDYYIEGMDKDTLCSRWFNSPN